MNLLNNKNIKIVHKKPTEYDNITNNSLDNSLDIKHILKNEIENDVNNDINKDVNNDINNHTKILNSFVDYLKNNFDKNNKDINKVIQHFIIEYKINDNQKKYLLINLNEKFNINNNLDIKEDFNQENLSIYDELINNNINTWLFIGVIIISIIIIIMAIIKKK